MKEEIKVRKACKKDIDKMLCLLKELFRMESVDFDRKTQYKGLLFLMENENRAAAFVAELDKEIIGMCTIQTLISTAKTSYTAYIEDLCVDSDYRNEGIGGSLLEYCEKWCIKNNIAGIHLLADGKNKKALNFYKKNGWKTTDYTALTKSPSDSFSETV
ncbi:GNAT family N-acetyltransferase [Flexistipes sp.]|uniref:GNAT family N-acetyltransferase n=1 Tax=Flexistipes sp. TaxID=3088135 RepID=UPI002E1BB922|nr:GNAT family N-acetyltransferase [Flexistipes sp.]